MRDRTGVREVQGNRAILRLEAAETHPVAGRGPAAHGTLLGKQAAQEDPVWLCLTASTTSPNS